MARKRKSKMPHINVPFTPEEYDQLTKEKGELTFRQFILMPRDTTKHEIRKIIKENENI